MVLENLAAAGFLTGRVDDMMDVNLEGRAFKQYGLEHFMRCDVHDAGGYLEGHPERSNLAGFSP
jgi:Xaa-Pro dipeptidase